MPWPAIRLGAKHPTCFRPGGPPLLRTTRRRPCLGGQHAERLFPPICPGRWAILRIGRGRLGATAKHVPGKLVKHAIIYDTDSFVIGGHAEALDACCHEAIANGATRAHRIRVAVPSHTKLLAEAVEPFRIALSEVTPQPPQVMYRLLSGIDGDTVHDVETGCDKLARQICTPVNWMACLESCREAEAELALEFGPGTALSHMAAPFFPAGGVRSTDEFHTVAGLRTWLSRASD